MSTKIALTDDLATCQALRRQVFIVEQGVSEAEEIDGQDEAALHLLATVDGKPVGTARLLIEGDTGKIGRVCVLPAQRGTGLGADLIRTSLRVLQENPALRQAKLGAQIQALGFYEKLGFTAFGPEYLDAGIPHRDMVLRFSE